MTAPARPASTVVLLRAPSGRGGGIETFLLERARSHAFMPGVHVFPGGRVDEADRDPAWQAHCEGLPALEARLGVHMDAPAVQGHAVAAVREVFEEAGIMLGRGRREAIESEATHTARRALLDGDVSFLALVRRLDVVLDLGSLLPWAHWITPEPEPRRFDTWFFVTLAPPAQTASVVHGEAVDGAWLSTQDALARYDRNELLLSPPTLVTLTELSGLDDLSRLASAAAFRPLPAILPRVVIEQGRPVVTLPTGREPGSAQRFTLEGSRWVALDAEQEKGPGPARPLS